MSWQIEISAIVRAITGDLTEPYTYCQEKLEELIVIAAQLTRNELDFDTTYTISISELSISPDPTTDRDDAFINLVALKTACLILTGEMKLAAGRGIKVTDAGASIDLTGEYNNTKQVTESICKSYQEGKLQYMLGNLNGIKAILTPYTSPNITGGIYFS